MIHVSEGDLSKEKCPTCGESLWGKTLITLTKGEKSVFSFCVTKQLLNELCIYLKMQGISDPLEFLRNFWHSEYEKHDADINWCSKVISYRCLLCGMEIECKGEKSSEAMQSHFETCSALQRIKKK